MRYYKLLNQTCNVILIITHQRDIAKGYFIITWLIMHAIHGKLPET